MSRVFLADEVRLARKVVIKVLPPEMGAGVNVERFEREIRLAAKLQHPHVVPLLTAGAEGDLLYYVMLFIKGESLRAKLAREGELPVGESVRILRDVTDALAYAHEEGVVHRDIKPDNVLLSGNHAVVTDFGVAKAVSASTGESSLTSLGVALGTPAYMSPEQAAADPHVDHRADIYAVGALAYEMLTGRPPFTGPSPQVILSAHVTQAPDPVTSHRDTVPAALEELIMRCLAKKAADRWQQAGELRAQFESLTTPSGGITPTGTQPVPAVSQLDAARKAHPVRVAVLFGFAAVGVLAVVYLLLHQLGLPDWVFLGALALLAIGLPIMLLTGHHERQRAMAQTTGLHVGTPVGLKRLFTWRKAILGGALAFAGLTIVTGGYMAMRLMGIGPVGTLVASGVLEEREPILLANFTNRTSDSTLGPSVTELFRVDFAQSRVIKLADARTTQRALRQMGREPTETIDVELAKELAEREGIKAYITGEIASVGSSYAISANLVSASDGAVLTAVRATAKDDGAIIGAIDELSAKLRERIGESLRTLRANPPLERVSTASLDALRKYTQGLRAEQEGDIARAMSLLREATTIDTSFAMAYRKQAVILGNTFAEPSEMMAAATKAYQHRDRLTDIERYVTIARYHEDVDYDLPKIMDAYRSVLEIDPTDLTAANNLSVYLSWHKDFAEAERLLKPVAELYDDWTVHQNLVIARQGQGDYAGAEAALERFATIRGDDDPYVLRTRGWLESGRGNYAVAEQQFRTILQSHRDLAWQQAGTYGLFGLMRIQGRLAEAQRHLRDNMEVQEQRGVIGAYLSGAVDQGLLEIRLRGGVDRGARHVQDALTRHPLGQLAPSDRPYLDLVSFYLESGDQARARSLLTEYEQAVPAHVRKGHLQRRGVDGSLALAEGRVANAIEAFRAWHEVGDPRCAQCSLHHLGRAYETAGQSDSALAVYQRAVNSNDLFRMYHWGDAVGPTLKRIGELHEERGNTEQAVEYYNRFVDLWQNADSELQPLVTEVRDRIARLVGEGN